MEIGREENWEGVRKGGLEREGRREGWREGKWEGGKEGRME